MHIIQTTGISNLGKDFEVIRYMAIQVTEKYPGARITVNDDEMHLSVEATCSGVALRAMLDKLINGGFI